MFHSKLITKTAIYTKAVKTFEEAWQDLNGIANCIDIGNIEEALILEDNKVVASARIIK